MIYLFRLDNLRTVDVELSRSVVGGGIGWVRTMWNSLDLFRESC